MMCVKYILQFLHVTIYALQTTKKKKKEKKRAAEEEPKEEEEEAPVSPVEEVRTMMPNAFISYFILEILKLFLFYFFLFLQTTEKKKKKKKKVKEEDDQMNWTLFHELCCI